MLLRSGTTPGPGSGVHLCADRDAIRPDECTILHWNGPGAEYMRRVGPGFDPQVLMPGSGEREIYPRATATHALQSPDRKAIAALIMHDRE
jgi:hypothetical protein